jgi:hypothetical protein
MPQRKSKIDRIIESKVKIGFVLIGSGILLGMIMAMIDIILLTIDLKSCLGQSYTIEIGGYKFTFPAILFGFGILGVSYEFLEGLIKAWRGKK